MLTEKEVAGFKLVIPMFITSMTGMGFSFTDREKITDIYFHPELKTDLFKIGTRIDQWGDRGSAKAIRTGETQTEILLTAVFGARLLMQNIPYVDEDGVIVGTVCLASLRQHSISSAFPAIAPVLSEMFPEGAGLYMTDHEKVVSRQGSSKFDLIDVKVGKVLEPTSVAMQSIKKRNIVSLDIPKEVYGVPVLNICYPLFDELDKHKAIGSFGIVMPQETSHSLRDISGKLNQSIGEIAAVIEELASSASEMMGNQRSLNQNVAEVSGFVVDINEILSLIRQIADETKMLGLNAAIEAARAGEAGAGFSVVASEIRKLSDESKETVGKIRNLTANIDKKVQQTIKRSESNMRSSEEQAAATEEVSASVQEITSMAHSLTELARKLN